MKRCAALLLMLFCAVSLPAVGEAPMFALADGVIWIAEGTVEIGSEAFAQTAAQRVMIPDSVTAIADDAFAGCDVRIVHAPEGSCAARWAAEHLPQARQLPYPDLSVPDPAEGLSCAADSTQIVLVNHNGGSRAEVSIHEKLGSRWITLETCPAFVGSGGIGKTREGDKKTPAGTFHLTQPFGIQPDPGAAQPYTQVTKYHYWCATSSSRYYNQMVDTRVTARARTAQDENLIACKGVYDYCLFVDYNAEGVPGKGSAIFLHCQGERSYTSGCIAIPTEVMKAVVQWARPGAKIVIR